MNHVTADTIRQAHAAEVSGAYLAWSDTQLNWAPDPASEIPAGLGTLTVRITYWRPVTELSPEERALAVSAGLPGLPDTENGDFSFDVTSYDEAMHVSAHVSLHGDVFGTAVYCSQTLTCLAIWQDGKPVEAL